MSVKITMDDFLGLLQAIAGGIADGIAKYRKERNAAIQPESVVEKSPIAEPEPASKTTPNSKPEATEKEESKGIDLLPVKRHKCGEVQAMVVNVLTTAKIPLSKDEIIKAFGKMFNEGLNKGTLNVILLQALKDNQIVRTGRGVYGIFVPKTESAPEVRKESPVEAVDEPANDTTEVPPEL